MTKQSCPSSQASSICTQSDCRIFLSPRSKRSNSRMWIWPCFRRSAYGEYCCTGSESGPLCSQKERPPERSARTGTGQQQIAQGGDNAFNDPRNHSGGEEKPRFHVVGNYDLGSSGFACCDVDSRGHMAFHKVWPNHFDPAVVACPDDQISFGSFFQRANRLCVRRLSLRQIRLNRFRTLIRVPAAKIVTFPDTDQVKGRLIIVQ